VYGLFLFQKECIFKIHLFTKKEISEKIREGKSIIRFGDGEINLLLGLKNHYHSFSPVLQKMLLEIVSEYQQNSRYILAIPRFITQSNEYLKTINKFNVWLPLKVIFWLKFNKNVSYYDAHSFYYVNYFETVIGPLLMDKHVVLVTKQATIEMQSNNPSIPWKQFTSIAAPQQEALDQYEIIVSTIDSHIAHWPQSEVVILFALGPVGKFIAYQFSQKGVQSLDIGKVAEVMYTESTIEYLI
jgi:hypothetical protein